MSKKTALLMTALAFLAVLTAPAALDSAGVDLGDASPSTNAEAIGVCPYTSGDAGDFEQCVGVNLEDNP